MNEIIQKINQNRESVKEYSDKKISDSDWKQILETIKWAPSSWGYEQYRVVIVDRSATKLREELLPAFFERFQITTADKIIFFASLSGKTILSDKWFYEREKRSLTEIEGVKEGDLEAAISKTHQFFNGFLGKITGTQLPLEAGATEWAKKQAYVALGMALSSATILGIGTTPLEGFDPQKVTEILRAHKLIHSDEQAAVGCAFGYAKDKKSYAHNGSGKRVRDTDKVKFVKA